MRNTLVALALAASLATTALGNGKVKITNSTNHEIKVFSFNWDDTIRSSTAQNGEVTIAVGDSHTMPCWKNVFDKNAPGCWLGFRDKYANANILSDTKRKNGWYKMTGTYDIEETRFDDGTIKKITNNNVTLQAVVGSTIRITKGQLPLSGGGTTECLSTSQAHVLADNGVVRLSWQGDGNLVLYRNAGGVAWASDTNGKAGRLCFQSDGNLVTYVGASQSWATGTYHSGNVLQLQTDCNLVMYDSNGGAKWATGTSPCY